MGGVVKKAVEFGSEAFWKGTPSSPFGFSPLGVASLAFTAYSTVQSQKYAKKQSKNQRRAIEEQNKADKARNRYNQLQQRRSKLQAIREARIRQAAATGSMGNVLGQGGTSGLVGSIGSYGTQTSTNVGNINVAQDVGNEIGQYNTMSANYQSAANSAGSKSSMWSSAQVLGGNLMTQGPQIKNIFNNL
jgi:hypothetical protein